jgi:hypothetical protein
MLKRACLAAMEVEEEVKDEGGEERGGPWEGVWGRAGDVMREAMAVKWVVLEVEGVDESEEV